MPTVSAAQALKNLASLPGRNVSTTLGPLDSALRNPSSAALDDSGSSGGVPCGKVSEIYGPPGVGKTTLG